jgi:hypothetical protein
MHLFIGLGIVSILIRMMVTGVFLVEVFALVISGLVKAAGRSSTNSSTTEGFATTKHRSPAR